MTEIEIMIHAKSYIDSLANSIDPISKCRTFAGSLIQTQNKRGGKKSALNFIPVLSCTF